MDIQKIREKLNLNLRPPMSWVTDPAHPDWGTPKAQEQRKRSLRRILHPIIYFNYLGPSINEDRAASDIGLWTDIWDCYRMESLVHRYDVDGWVKEYASADVVVYYDKEYFADNAETPDIVAKILRARGAGYFRFSFWISSYNDNYKHLFDETSEEITRVWEPASRHAPPSQAPFLFVLAFAVIALFGVVMAGSGH